MEQLTDQEIQKVRGIIEAFEGGKTIADLDPVDSSARPADISLEVSSSGDSRKASLKELTGKIAVVETEAEYAARAEAGDVDNDTFYFTTE